MIVSQYTSMPLQMVVKNFNDAVQENDQCLKSIYWALSVPAALLSMLSLLDILLLVIPYGLSILYKALFVESFYNNKDNAIEEYFGSSLSTFLGALQTVWLATLSLVSSNEKI